MGIRVGSATVQMRNAKKKVKKRTMLSLVREQKNAAEPTEGRDLHNHKSTEVSERREALG